MADDKIALSIEIESDRANMSLGELEDGFEELQKKLKATNRGTDKGRKEFKRLATQMAQTSKEIKNIELSFEGLDREQVASEIGSVAGAVGDLSASLFLLGGENESLAQTALNIEKAMRVSMGLKASIEGLASARKLYNNLLRQANDDEKEGIALTVLKTVKEKAAAAGTLILNGVNKLLNTTLKANPIGILVTALTLVVAGIVYFKDAIWDIIKTALKPFQFIIDLVIDGLQAMGIMATDEAIAQEEAAKKVVEAAKQRNEAAAEQRRVHKELVESMVADLDFEIRKRTIAGEDFAELSRKKIELLKEVAEEEAKAAEQNRMALEQTMKTMGSFGKFYEELYDETTETAKKAAAEARKLSEDLVIHDLEQEKKRKDERDKGAADRAMARSKEQQAKKDALMEDIELDEKKATLRENEINATDEFTNNLIEINKSLAFQKEEEHQKELARIEAERQAKIEAAQASMDLALTTLNAISDVSNTLANEDLKAEEERFNNLRATKQFTEKQLAAEELNSAKIKDKIREKQFENDKKMQIAMAAINGAQALTSIFAQYPKFDGGFAMVAALATSVITTAATIAKIKATTFSSTPAPALPTLDSGDGGPTGPDAGGGAAITPVSNTSTILGNQQVFVTETDITNTQNNVSVIEESATF